jgi:hypothetical protein
MATPIEDLIAFLRSQPAGISKDPDEFEEDLVRYLRSRRSQSVPSRRRDSGEQAVSTNTGWGDVQFPKTLQQRIDDWHSRRLRRLEFAIESTRKSLGFDEVPFPGDVGLADELWDWLPRRRRRLNTPGAEPSARVSRALAQVKPRNPFVRPEDMTDEMRARNYEGSLSEIIQVSDAVAEDLGCAPIYVARWLLAGVEPRQQCLVVGLLETTVGPNVVTLRINPDVVTAEEIRTVYRRACKTLDATASDRFYKFFLPLAGHGRLTLPEQFELWNELHPLHQYKDKETFRGALYNARRRDPNIGRRW